MIDYFKTVFCYKKTVFEGYQTCIELNEERMEVTLHPFTEIEYTLPNLIMVGR